MHTSQVADIGALIDQLNESGELLLIGSGTYKVNRNIDMGAASQQPGTQSMSQQVRKVCVFVLIKECEVMRASSQGCRACHSR